MKPIAILLVGLLLLVPAAFAGESDGAARSSLPRLLAAYDQRGGGNTIPIEKEILRLRDEHTLEALLPHLEHPRFGETVVWAACSVAGEAEATKLVDAMMGWSDERKTAVALYVARLPGEAADAFLGDIARDATTPVEHLRRQRAAALLRGAEHRTKAVRTALSEDEPAKVADALLTLALTREPKLLPMVVPLLLDKRNLHEPVTSVFRITRREEVGPGRVRITNTSPSLKSVGDLALETANRLVLPTTPEYIAWWYDWEKTPRFGFGEVGVTRLVQWLEARDQGAAAGLPPLEQAAAVALTWLRGARERRPESGVTVIDWKPEGGGWTLTLALGKENITLGVDGELRLTNRRQEKRPPR